MAHEWYETLPRTAREALSGLSVMEPVDLSVLRSQVDEHLAVIEDAAQHNEFLDVELARRIAAACHAILDLGPLSGADRMAAQAAIRYFVLREDADDDLTSIVGLEDDVQVVNAVLHHLQHPELVIEL